MPTGDGGCGPNLSPHLAYFAAKARAKGASPRKAEAWARRMVRRGKRAHSRGTSEAWARRMVRKGRR